MRFLTLVIGLALPGCFTGEAWCDPDEMPCPPALAPAACTGQCAPYIGGPWSPVLVADAPECPEEAPFAALSSDTPPLLACGAPIVAGSCSTPGYVCLPPALPPWTVCVVRDGRHACPDPYPAPTSVEGVTICCPGPPDEPP